MNLKIFVIFSLCLIGLIQADDLADLQQIWKDPVPFLTEIEKQIPTANRELQQAGSLANNLQTMAYAINQQIIAADSPTWLNPSPERKEVIAKWAERLTPYTQNLVNLAFGDGFSKSEAAIQSRSVLDFAPATPVFAEQVRPFLKRAPLLAYAAADLLYEHRLLTDADKQLLRELKPDAQDHKSLERWAKETSGLEMTDGLQIAKSVFESGLSGESPEEIITQFGDSLGVVYALGTDASILTPQLESLIANPVIKSSGYLAHFENARDIVSGKQARQGRVAKNGSGPLSPWLLAAAPPQPEVNPMPDRGANSTKASDFKSAPKSMGEGPSSSPPWVVIVVLITAVLGLVWLLIKRRS